MTTGSNRLSIDKQHKSLLRVAEGEASANSISVFFFVRYRNKGKFPLYSLRVCCNELGKADKYEKRGKLRNMERFIEGKESRGGLEGGRKQVLEERNMPWPGETSRASGEGTGSLGG